MGTDLRVLLAEGPRLSRDLLQHFLTGQGMACTAVDTLPAATLALSAARFDVVAVDAGLLQADGTRRLLRAAQGTPVGVILPGAGPQAQALLAAGIRGILLRTMPARSLTNALRFLAAGETYLPPDAGQPQGTLSPGEMRVLSVLSEGQPNKGIAHVLQVAEPTVKMHVTAICRKLGARNRTQAVLMARERGLV